MVLKRSHSARNYRELARDSPNRTFEYAEAYAHTGSTVTLSSPGTAQPTAMNEPLPSYSEALRPIDAHACRLGEAPCRCHCHFDGA
jgi:hypothetical protein